MRILVLAGLLAVAGSPGASAQVRAPMPLLTPMVLAANYTIGPRDVLVINIFGDPTLSGEVVVGTDGMIEVWQRAKFKAQGLRLSELRKELTAELRKLYTRPPAVTISVKEINSRRVLIPAGGGP